MNLYSILEEHEKVKTRLKTLFRTRGKIQAYMDFDDLEIIFIIKPPMKKAVLDIARDMLEVSDKQEIIIRGKGLLATNQIKNKINRFVAELENIQ